jgi:hypothetical protein
VSSTWSVGTYGIGWSLTGIVLAWAATKGNAELAKKCLKRINWGVKDYDVDAQYRLLEMAIDHELEEAAINHKSTKWYSIFSGVDGVSRLID